MKRMLNCQLNSNNNYNPSFKMFVQCRTAYSGGANKLGEFKLNNAVYNLLKENDAVMLSSCLTCGESKNGLGPLWKTDIHPLTTHFRAYVPAEKDSIVIENLKELGCEDIVTLECPKDKVLTRKDIIVHRLMEWTQGVYEKFN